MKQFEPVSENIDDIAKKVVDAGFKVHQKLGPGLLESVYEKCLCYELAKRNIAFTSQVALPVVYDNVKIEAGLRLDILVENTIILEIKAVEKMNQLHKAQLMTYLKLTGHRLGLLINFNVHYFKDGIKRIIL